MLAGTSQTQCAATPLRVAYLSDATVAAGANAIGPTVRNIAKRAELARRMRPCRGEDEIEVISAMTAWGTCAANGSQRATYPCRTSVLPRHTSEPRRARPSKAAL